LSKDWTGGKGTGLKTIGAHNGALNDRDENDYYATEPKAATLLLEKEKFSPRIWECACGEGHLSKVIKKAGYEVLSTDLVDRGYGVGNVDFLQCEGPFDGDIITNPPYKFGLEFVKHAVDIVTEGHKVAMFLKLQFLEGKKRRAFFETTPPVRFMWRRGDCIVQ